MLAEIEGLDVLQSLCVERLGAQAIVLFGSRAAHSALDSSDWDVAVVTTATDLPDYLNATSGAPSSLDATTSSPCAA